MLKLRETGIELLVKVLPGSSVNAIIGKENDRLKIKLTVVAEKGRANEALIDLLSHFLGISKRQVTILSGLTSRNKKTFIALSDQEKERIYTILSNL